MGALDIVNDKQWDSSQPTIKGKSCNIISLAHEDDIIPTTSLSSSKEKDFALAAQPAISQSVDNRSGK